MLPDALHQRTARSEPSQQPPPPSLRHTAVNKPEPSKIVKYGGGFIVCFVLFLAIAGAIVAIVKPSTSHRSTSATHTDTSPAPVVLSPTQEQSSYLASLNSAGMSISPSDEVRLGRDVCSWLSDGHSATDAISYVEWTGQQDNFDAMAPPGGNGYLSSELVGVAALDFCPSFSSETASVVNNIQIAANPDQAAPPPADPGS